MSSVLKCHAEAQINTPASLVYALLTDLSQWSTWNEMVPQVTITHDPSSDTTNNNMHMKFGQRLQFHVRMPIFGARRSVPGGSVEEIVRLDPVPTDGPSRIEWDQRGIPQALLKTNRVNIIEPAMDTPGTCKYTSYMTFDGPMAYSVKLFQGGTLQAEFDRWVLNLKNEAERRHAEPAASSTS